MPIPPFTIKALRDIRFNSVAHCLAFLRRSDLIVPMDEGRRTLMPFERPGWSTNGGEQAQAYLKRHGYTLPRHEPRDRAEYGLIIDHPFPR